MKYWIWLIFTLVLLAGCSPPAQVPVQEEENIVAKPTLQRPTTIPPEGDFELAPELTNGIWLNTEEPLRLANLRGKVVLLDMWTFG